jgi:hypothetical protein
MEHGLLYHQCQYGRDTTYKLAAETLGKDMLRIEDTRGLGKYEKEGNNYEPQYCCDSCFFYWEP